METNTINNEYVTPSTDTIINFWSNIWSKQVYQNENSAWIFKDFKNEWNAMEFQNISENLLKNIVRKCKSWKCPGIDFIQNFWYKQFTCTHKPLSRIFTSFLYNPHLMPTLFVSGNTLLIPKNEHTEDPSCYRPITCLPSIYKILMSCITKLIQNFISDHNIIAEEQKGCKRNRKGTKDQLLIDSIILEQSKKYNRNLYTIFIDYKKAYDSIPHSWILDILKFYKINPKIIDFLNHNMNFWETSLNICSKNKFIKTHSIKIKRGIFQGDTFSPLLFCLCINPLSHILNATKYGYTIKIPKNNLKFKISHLLFMDDLKLYSSNKNHLQQLLKITEKFSKDIKMEFGMEKCKSTNIVKNKCKTINYELENNYSIQSLSENEFYKYLAIKQNKNICHTKIKKKL